MAKSDFEKKSAYVFLSLLTIVIIVYNIYLHYDLKAIEATGIEVHAKVTSVNFSRGYIAKIEFQYSNRKYTNSFDTSDFRPDIGDSVAIKIHPEKPEGNFIFKRRFYSFPVVHESHFDWLHKVNKHF